jgi:trigger factor
MEVRIEKPKSYIREMHISVPYEQYAKEMARITQSYQSAAEIPGFRKGKAPISMVATSYRSEIEKEAKENVIRDVFSRAVREHHLLPITYAEIEGFTASEERDLVSFSVRFQVIPDFKLSLDGLDTTFKPAPVAEESVTKVIQDLQEKFTTVKPVSRASQSGDAIEFDYVACDTAGVEVDSAQGMIVVCGKGKGLLESQLVGVKQGEQRESDIPYPSTFPVMELHGTNVRIKMGIKEVKEKAVPEINDEFAKTVGIDSLGKLRSSIRKQLENEEEMIARANARDKMLEILLKQNDFDVPDALLGYYREQQKDGGFEKDEKEKIDEVAERKARLNIILDKIAELKELKVPEEDINGFLEREAARESVDPQKLRSYLVQTGKMQDIVAMFKREMAFAELEKQYLKKE